MPGSWTIDHRFCELTRNAVASRSKTESTETSVAEYKLLQADTINFSFLNTREKLSVTSFEARDFKTSLGTKLVTPSLV